MYCDSLVIEKETSGQVRYKYRKELIMGWNSQASHKRASDVVVKSHEVEKGVETSFVSCMLVEMSNSRT